MASVVLRSICGAILMLGALAAAEAAETGTTSGLPVPRFVSLKSDKVNVRSGPTKDHDVAWTVALDPGSVAALDFGTRGQPETYAISPSGTVAAAKFGPMEPGQLDTFLAAARQTG